MARKKIGSSVEASSSHTRRRVEAHAVSEVQEAQVQETEESLETLRVDVEASTSGSTSAT